MAPQIAGVPMKSPSGQTIVWCELTRNIASRDYLSDLSDGHPEWSHNGVEDAWGDLDLAQDIWLEDGVYDWVD
ncbi:hypothetical protein HHX47_DHR10000319 [Lentinula edodes]|nr:hypothetical protein HHX47_DHR10000319 [Lentinula edodes]